MSEFLAELIAMVSPSFISDVFLVFIITLFGCSTAFLILDKVRPLVSMTPNLLTSLGILGTFTGIVAGLMEFDPTNITASIPALLEGLKTAFLTSLFGMLFSILFKGAETVFSKQADNDYTDGATADDIYKVMKKLLITNEEQKDTLNNLNSSINKLEHLAEYSEKQLKVSEELVKAIKGDEDASLVSQIRNMRTDINDASRNLSLHSQEQKQRYQEFQQKLWHELENFGELLSKSATEQVITALKDVIVDFNNQLTEQFGDNFKRLDESVKKLVDWQENYRLQLEQMNTQYQLGVDSIAATEKSVSTISDKAEIIPTAMHKLHEVMALGHEQIETLEERLNAFAELRDKAVTAMPQIQSHLEETIKQIGDSVQAATSHHEHMLVQSNQAIEHFAKATNDGAEQVKQTLVSSAAELSEQLTAGAESIKNSLTDSASTLRTELTTGSENIKQTLLTSTSELSEQLATGAHDINQKFTQAANTLETSSIQATTNMEQMKHALTTTADQLHQQLENAMKELTNDMRTLVTNIKEDAEKTSKTLSEANQHLLSDTKTIRDQSINAITQMQSKLELSLEEIFSKQSKEIHRTFSSVEEQIVKTVEKTGASVESQVDYLDKQIQQEINRTMQEMGTQLATVTGQFTRDYEKLTRQMKQVVSSAEGIY